jgi:hypothetical protein
MSGGETAPFVHGSVFLVAPLKTTLALIPISSLE